MKCDAHLTLSFVSAGEEGGQKKGRHHDASLDVCLLHAHLWHGWGYVWTPFSVRREQTCQEAEEGAIRGSKDHQRDDPIGVLQGDP